MHDIISSMLRKNKLSSSRSESSFQCNSFIADNSHSTSHHMTAVTELGNGKRRGGQLPHFIPSGQNSSTPSIISNKEIMLLKKLRVEVCFT